MISTFIPEASAAAMLPENPGGCGAASWRHAGWEAGAPAPVEGSARGVFAPISPPHSLIPLGKECERSVCLGSWAPGLAPGKSGDVSPPAGCQCTFKNVMSNLVLWQHWLFWFIMKEHLVGIPPPHTLAGLVFLALSSQLKCHLFGENSPDFSQINI